MEKPSKTKPKTTNQTQDSMTDVYFRLDEPRGVVSFRCNKALWFAFKKQIRAQGLSICHVLEPMIFGWLNGYVNISSTIKPLKIENLIVERAVKRVRRYGVECEAEELTSVPFYDLNGGVWRKVKVDNDWDVNVHGHRVGCGCTTCMPNAKKG